MMVIDSIWLDDRTVSKLVCLLEVHNKNSKEETTFQDLAEMILKRGIEREYSILNSFDKARSFDD